MIGIMYALALMLGVPGVVMQCASEPFADTHFAGFVLALAGGFLGTLAWLGSKLA